MYLQWWSNGSVVCHLSSVFISYKGAIQDVLKELFHLDLFCAKTRRLIEVIIRYSASQHPFTYVRLKMLLFIVNIRDSFVQQSQFCVKTEKKKKDLVTCL